MQNETIYGVDAELRGWWPSQWPDVDFSSLRHERTYRDEYGRNIYEFEDGTCFIFEHGFVDDFLPLLT